MVTRFLITKGGEKRGGSPVVVKSREGIMSAGVGITLRSVIRPRGA